MRKSGPDVPPGYDPALDAKPKTKAAKRNERRKEKRHQVGLPLSLMCHHCPWMLQNILIRLNWHGYTLSEGSFDLRSFVS